MLIPDRFNPMARNLRSRAPAPPGAETGLAGGALTGAPLGGTRTEAVRRLQIGTVGVVAVLMLIGLASIIKDRATQTESTAVPEAAATVAPRASAPAADPLAEAGVVPEIPASPTADAADEAAAAVTTGARLPASPPATPPQDGR